METKSAIDCKQVYELIALGPVTVCDVEYEPGATIKTTDVDRRNYLVDEVKFAKDVTDYATEEFDDTPVVPLVPASKDESSKVTAKPPRVTRTRR